MDHFSSGDNPTLGRFHGERALAGQRPAKVRSASGICMPEDFHRGECAYDRFIGIRPTGPRRHWEPSQPHFYAVAIAPGRGHLWRRRNGRQCAGTDHRGTSHYRSVRDWHLHRLRHGEIVSGCWRQCRSVVRLGIYRGQALRAVRRQGARRGFAAAEPSP